MQSELTGARWCSLNLYAHHPNTIYAFMMIKSAPARRSTWTWSCMFMKCETARWWWWTLNTDVSNHRRNLITLHVFMLLQKYTKHVLWCKFKPASEWSCKCNLHFHRSNLKLRVDHHPACTFRLMVMQATTERASWFKQKLNIQNAAIWIWICTLVMMVMWSEAQIWKTIWNHNLVTSTCMLVMQMQLGKCKLQLQPASSEECIINLHVDQHVIWTRTLMMIQAQARGLLIFSDIHCSTIRQDILWTTNVKQKNPGQNLSKFTNPRTTSGSYSFALFWNASNTILGRHFLPENTSTMSFWKIMCPNLCMHEPSGSVTTSLLAESASWNWAVCVNIAPIANVDQHITHNLELRKTWCRLWAPSHNSDTWCVKFLYCVLCAVREHQVVCLFYVSCAFRTMS